MRLFIQSLTCLLTAGLLSAALPAWAQSQQSAAEAGHASILMYHHVSDQTPPATSTRPDTFVQHLDLLENEGFQVWPLPKVVQHLKTSAALPDKVAAITFDDAYISVYEEALPELKARGLPFTVFVNAEPVSQNNALYMSWDQLRDIQKQGATLANHSLTHPHMIRQAEGEDQTQWLARMRTEIETNQQQLEQHLGKTPKLFAYPYGEFNPALEKLLAELGYTAFGQHSGPASSFASFQGLPRYAAGGIYANPKTLKTKLLALPFPVIKETPASGVLNADQRSPQLQLTLAAGDYRLNQLRCYGPGGEVMPVERSVLAEGQVEVRVQTGQTLGAGRHRYNCTAPHKTENRWFWFSRQWMLPKADGRWYAN